MRNLFLTLTLLFFSFTTLGQTKAITEDGKEVILYDNGTWEPSNKSSEEKIEFIPEKNGEGELRLYLVHDDKKYDVGKWFIVELTANHNIRSTEIVNEKLEGSECEIYAEYVVPGFLVRYCVKKESGRINVYKIVYNNITEEEDSELVSTIE